MSAGKCIAGARLSPSQTRHLSRTLERERVIALAVEIAGIVEPRDQEAALHPFAAFDCKLIIVERAAKRVVAQSRLGRRADNHARAGARARDRHRSRPTAVRASRPNPCS